MSFNTVTDKAEVRGWERANFNHLIAQLGHSILPSRARSADYKDVLPADHHLMGQAFYILDDSQWRASFQQDFMLGDMRFVINGVDVSSFTLSLNTAMLLGNDAVKLAARLHAQCESYCWIDGPNRAWVAGIIENGTDNVFRTNSGWEEVVALLHSSDEGEVVVSESIGSSFPNHYNTDEGFVDHRTLTEEQKEEQYALSDAWYELPRVDQWESGMGWLRQQKGMLEITPATWDGYRFSSKLSSFDLKKAVPAS